MHELGVLLNAIQTVNKIALENKIKKIKFLTLEVGTESTFVPAFLEKLFPIAKENFPVFKKATLNLLSTSGKRLIIKEFGY